MKRCLSSFHRFRKNLNPQRNSKEDRIGSYETIGRLVFKTCEDSEEDPILSKIRNIPNPTFFSILNNLRNVIHFNDNGMELQRSQSDILPQINDTIIKNQDIMNGLKSHHSFSSGLNRWDHECNKYVNCSCTDCKCQSFYDILPICSTCDNYTQTVKTRTACGLLNSVVSYIMEQFHLLKHTRQM